MADLSTIAEVFRRRGHGIIADLRSGQHWQENEAGRVENGGPVDQVSSMMQMSTCRPARDDAAQDRNSCSDHGAQNLEATIRRMDYER